MKKIVCVIPARGGSKGIPRKNIKSLAGKPLISYNISASKNSGHIIETYVSTDDQEIAEISSNFGAKIIDRPKEFATDTASSESALLHFAENVDFDVLVFLQCTSPLTKTEDIDGAIEKYLFGNYDSVLSVCEDRGGFLCGGFTWDEDGNSVNYDFKNRKRRQQNKRFYRENGAIYVFSKEGLLKHKNRLHEKVGLYVMPSLRSFEIDEPEDFLTIEKLFTIDKRQDNVNNNNFHMIKMVIFDCDGVLTDGSVYMDPDGKETLRFSRIDGHGIGMLNKAGYILGIISSENSEIIRKRAEKLNISEVFLGIKDKLKIYQELKDKYNLKDGEICYCGDDLSDMEILKKVGLSCCPSNSQPEVKEICTFVSEYEGSNGFVRQVSNLILKSIKSKEILNKGDKEKMKTLKINDVEISNESKPFFIAEIGINHNGSMDLAKKMIDLAVITGVNAVKFQKRTVELCVPDNVKNSMRETPWGKMTYFDYKKKIEFEEEEYKEIDRYCKEKGILWTASVWDIPSLEFIERFNVAFHKIPSALLTHKDLLLKIKETGKPVILSTGMSTEEEVLKAVSLFGENYPLAILHCNSGYPAKEEELNLNYILNLKQMFPNNIIGYSGHERGISATLVAATLGAKILERHITLDRSMWGTDQAASIEFDGLRRLVRDLNSLNIWFGNGIKTVTETEKTVRDKLRNVNTL